jgi:hypothetical protein
LRETASMTGLPSLMTVASRSWRIGGRITEGSYRVNDFVHRQP